jgi:predicted nuclease of restriction endonuclease-like (RecB) superfamily
VTARKASKLARRTTRAAKSKDVAVPGNLLSDVREMICEARGDVARQVNSTLVMLYWRVGGRVGSEILGGERAEYGERIVATLSQQLTADFGRGWSRYNLSRMIKLADHFPDQQIVATLSQQLSWSHFMEIIPFEDDLKRDFYAEMCRLERWSVRTLRKKIDGMLYERTALAKKPENIIRYELDTLREQDQLMPDLVFKDPYFLDFLGLNDRYIEKDVEDAILREMEQFILELGVGFTFVARQKRIQVGDDDFYLDLLFFHRKLRRLVAIDLKLGKFKPAYKGQMELYLRWLEEYEQQPNEESPIGLILCAGKSEEQIKLLRLDEGSIRVAAYMTELPPRPVLEKKLHEAMVRARRRLTSGPAPSTGEGATHKDSLSDQEEGDDA